MSSRNLAPVYIYMCRCVHVCLFVCVSVCVCVCAREWSGVYVQCVQPS